VKCFGCQREIEIGDRYIEDSASGFLGKPQGGEADGILADIFGDKDGKVVFCEDCTVPGGEYMAETYWGET
jgi:hypothetical protein